MHPSEIYLVRGGRERKSENIVIAHGLERSEHRPLREQIELEFFGILGHTAGRRELDEELPAKIVDRGSAPQIRVQQVHLLHARVEMGLQKHARRRRRCHALIGRYTLTRAALFRNPGPDTGSSVGRASFL